METSLESLLIPEKWQPYFELKQLIKKDAEVNMILEEKEFLIPQGLKGKDVVQNGFMAPVEIIDFPARGRLMYIKFRRRRWKERGLNESYHNDYTFHRKGMKTTDEFGDFLKGLAGEEFVEFCSAWPGVLDFWEEDL